MPRKGKCFSTCRKRPKSNCDPPECHYTNGNKYKYCRLAFTRKMNKDCVPVLKNLRTMKDAAKSKFSAETPDRFFDSMSSVRPARKRYAFSPMSPTPSIVHRILKRPKSPSGTRRKSRSRSLSLSGSDDDFVTPPQSPRSASKTRKYGPESMDITPTKEDIAAFREKYAKKAATRKIGKFLRRTDPRVRAKFLQSVCSDSGVCIAFGTNAAAIRKHFDDFNNFNLLSKPAERIGSVSANGFVKELTYVNRGYTANAVLKSSASPDSDNLLYESLVGFFLNKMSMMYPTFLETYGLYRYNADRLAYNACKNDAFTDATILSVGLTRVAQSAKDISNTTVKNSCTSPTSMAVLIQHLKAAKTIRERCAARLFVVKDLLYVLYQVYMTLSSLSRVFTHYDLHRDNVLVYEPVVGSHIEYHYHFADGTETIFNSKYIAKIIDYGRCYYNDESSKSNVSESKSFRDGLVCKECKPRCGSGRGYEWLDYKANRMKGSAYICSQRLNPSHDLRLIYSIGNKVAGMSPALQTLIGRVVYGKGVKKGNEMYGTEPRQDSGLPMKIHNVADAFAALRELVEDPVSEVQNDIDYRGSMKLGELHIYGNRPMRWVPTK